MKVAIISSAYYPFMVGGGERSAQELAENLQSLGVDVFVVAAHNQDQKEVVNGVLVYRIKSPNVYWSYETNQMPWYKKVLWHAIESYNPWTLNKILPILEREQPDIIQIRNYHNLSTAVWKLSARLGIPTVQTLNDYTALCSKITMFRNSRVCSLQCVRCRLLTWPRKHMSNYVKQVVSVSDYTLQVHQRHGYFSNAKATTIHTTPAQGQDVALPVVANNFVTFGFIGRLHPSKGALEAIDAFCQAHLTEGRLLVAGEGASDYLDQCKAKARNNPNVCFIGKVGPDHFYRQVDVVIVPSLWGEPFPRVVPEAYTYHRPVIVSDRGGSAEAVTPTSGWVFSADDFTTLTQIIVQINSHPESVSQTHEAIKQRVRNLLPADQDALQYLNVYQHACTEA